MYQKRSKCKKWKRKSRYADFFKRLCEEQALKKSRSDLVTVLAQISDQKCEEYWNFAVPILTDMKNELDSLGRVPSIMSAVPVIKYCVRLFEITSKYQDLLDGSLSCAPAGKEESFNAFNNDLYYSGRHSTNDLRKDSIRGPIPYWNTTRKGEPINEETIQFGPELGLPRQPVSYWLKLSKKKKVYVQEVTQYSKGNLAKVKPIWATDALVRTGIHNFCKVAISALTQELENLLAD